MLDPNFVYLAAAITLIGISAYAIETLRGRTQPNLVTWTLWTIVPLITFFGQLSKDVGLSSLYALAYALGPLFVVIASFANKKAYWHLTLFDYLCGAISLLALLLWYTTGDGLLAIILSITADFVAGLPTLRKGFRHPGSENTVAYIAGIFSATITLLTIQTWNLATGFFPIYILLDSALIYLTIKVFSRFSRLNPKAKSFQV
jgi:hypothetical protein